VKLSKKNLRVAISAIISEEVGSPSFPLDPNQDGNLTPMELFHHFDLDADGQVSVQDYEDHVRWHCLNDDGFQQEMTIEQTVPLHLADSGIHGTGVFATDDIPVGTNLGISHIAAGDGFIPTNLGAFHNHSVEPNAGNVLRRGVRRLFALSDIRTGDEITVDYRQQPDLQQPENFRK
jgi:hypothetical protein